jgi:hypothetical protein
MIVHSTAVVIHECQKFKLNPSLRTNVKIKSNLNIRRDAYPTPAPASAIIDFVVETHHMKLSLALKVPGFFLHWA